MAGLGIPERTGVPGRGAPRILRIHGPEVLAAGGTALVARCVGAGWRASWDGPKPHIDSWPVAGILGRVADELVIRAVGGPTSVAFRSLGDPFGDGYFHDVRVELRADGLAAGGVVRLEHPALGADPDLVAYLEDLADGWQGWTGAREWASLARDLLLDARHDGRREVLIGFTLRIRRRYDEEPWSARVVVPLEPGEQMTRLAMDLRELLTSAP